MFINLLYSKCDPKPSQIKSRNRTKTKSKTKSGTVGFKTLHYINGVDKAGTKIMCIGEVVDGTIVDVFFKYLIAKYNKGEA